MPVLWENEVKLPVCTERRFLWNHLWRIPSSWLTWLFERLFLFIIYFMTCDVLFVCFVRIVVRAEQSTGVKGRQRTAYDMLPSPKTINNNKYLTNKGPPALFYRAFRHCKNIRVWSKTLKLMIILYSYPLLGKACTVCVKRIVCHALDQINLHSRHMSIDWYQ